MKLGAIRLTSMFIKEGSKGPVDQDTYSRMRKHVKSLIVHSIQSLNDIRVELAIGSSGTIINLAEISTRAYGCGNRGLSLKYSNLKKLTQMLCSLPLEERRKVPGMNPERADIIIGGACILETIMDELKVDEIQVSDRGVRDGLLVDYLSKIEGYPHAQRMSVRETSVLQLGRSCNIDEKHAETVVRIALSLFDSSRTVGLHSYGQKERELLKFAAYLHDIGDFISFTNHQAHSYYIVRNADLLGFDEENLGNGQSHEISQEMCSKKKDPDLEELDEKSQQAVIILASLLRLAESLDRSHASLVQSVQFLKVDKEKAVLEVSSDKDVQLEVWGVEGDARAFERSFDRDLLIKVRRCGDASGI